MTRPVGSDSLAQWYMPDLQLIGDAAHIMSPVGGVDIDYAIQDAVVAANGLAETLKAGTLQLDHLVTVQRQREWPTRAIRAFQGQIQRGILAPARHTNTPFLLLHRLVLSHVFRCYGMCQFV